MVFRFDEFYKWEIEVFVPSQIFGKFELAFGIQI